MTRDEDTYLTEPEIRRLTGRVYPKHQCKVLAEQNWPFSPDGDGKPLVLRAAHDERLGLKTVGRRRGPRLAGLASA